MNISAHFLVDVLLIAALLVVVLAESTLRRRIHHFRTLQLFIIGSALLLVPANIVSALVTTPSLFHSGLLVVTVAVIIAQMVMVAVNWLPVDRATAPRRILAIGAHPDDLELACGVTVHRGRRLDTRLDDSMLVSEFAPGVEYAPNVFVAADPRDDIAVVLRKTGLKSGDHGNATGVERVDEPDVARLALAACRALGLRGPADVDVRRRADGTPLVLEVNARFGANSAHAPELLDAVLARVGVPA